MKISIPLPDERDRCPGQCQLVALVLFLAAASGLAGCSRDVSADTSQKKAKAVPVPVRVSKASEKEMAVEIRAIGNVQPYITPVSYLCLESFQEWFARVVRQRRHGISDQPAPAAL